MLMILVLHGLHRCICGAFVFFGEAYGRQSSRTTGRCTLARLAAV